MDSENLSEALTSYTTTQLGILVENCTDFGIFFTRHDDMVEIHRKRPKQHDKFVFSAPNKVWRSSYCELEDYEGDNQTHIFKIGYGTYKVLPMNKILQLHIEKEIIAKIRLQKGRYDSHENYCSKNPAFSTVKFFDLCRSKVVQNPIRDSFCLVSGDEDSPVNVGTEIDLGLRFAVAEIGLSYFKARQRFVEGGSFIVETNS